MCCASAFKLEDRDSTGSLALYCHFFNKQEYKKTMSYVCCASAKAGYSLAMLEGAVTIL